ncbi:MAG: TetR/AcrR family transcriptional regulator [Proteobacteria bacterium]|nr:TetR/AcrR family transcriptional regulator [Pseudomonadota bacterium]
MRKSKGELTRDYIIKTTRKILVAQGFHNTSINDIINATGVKKGNLYYYFAGKEDLSFSVLQDAKEEFFAFLEQSFQGNDPIDKVIHSCEAIFKEQQKQHFVGGCLFGNVALEMSDCNERFAAVIHEVFTTWTQKLAILLEEAGENTIPVSRVPPRQLAKTLVAVIEGGIMMSRVSKSKADLEDCLGTLQIMLGR